MIWTSVEQIIMIHSKIIAKTGGLDGIRDMNGLESAFAAPMQTFDGIELFKTDLEKIARLMASLQTTPLSMATSVSAQ